MTRSSASSIQLAALTTIWYEALKSEFGIKVSVSDSNLFKAKMYAARREASDPDLANISIRTSPDDQANEVWLVKQPPQE